MKLFSRFLKKPKAQTNMIGAPSFAQINPGKWYSQYCASNYDSAYPNIRAIADEYITIMPKAIDSNGKTVQDNNIINALYHPNQKDDIVSFNEKIVVSTLVFRNTFLLVWSKKDGKSVPGGDFGRKGQNIAGFTFLENPGITRRDGKTYYNIGSQYFTEDEVITIPGGVNPDDLYAGYSPTEAATKWITLDDYIADFQKGFFENNAIPAGMFVVTARTTKEYNDIVDMLMDRHKGAGKNNNVSYTHRPLDANNSPVNAQIEWIPFSQSQKDIDFSAVFEQTNKRIDMAYGVSQIIKGVDDQAKYSNADVSERGFAKRVVYPRALRNYTRITHELNRITGGIGVAITFDYEIPEIADKQKVEAETRRVNIDTLLLLEDRGYTIDSSVDALKLPLNYKLLKKGNQTQTAIENDKPQVDDGNEVDTSPNPDKIDGVSTTGEAKHRPKAELTDLEQLESVSRNYMQKRVDRSIKEYGKTVNAEEESTEDDDLDAFVAAAIAIAVAIMTSSGEVQYTAGKVMFDELGLLTENADKFKLAELAKEDYQAHLRRVGTTYDSETKQSIDKVLELARSEGWGEKLTKDTLRDVMKTDEWRVSRLARSELNRSQSLGDVEAMKQLENETGVEVEKTISHPLGAECDMCRSMEGIWKSVSQPMLALGDSIESDDGTIYINDFEDNQGHDYHPNGAGRPKFRVKSL